MTNVFIDQMGETIHLGQPPKRIVSLVPSQTELLFDLGLDAEIAGITQFCIHPADKIKDKPTVGGTKQFDFAKIDQLQPDLILGNKEENYAEGIGQLRQKYPVWMSDIFTLADAVNMIKQVGQMVGKANRAGQLVNQITDTFANLPKAAAPIKVAYFIWKTPMMVAGKQTFINELLSLCGFQNVFAHLDRYPVVTAADIEAAQPDFLFLSSEPFHFQAKHLPHFKETFPDSTPILVDGELFSWYGSRLLKMPAYCRHLHNKLQRFTTNMA